MIKKTQLSLQGWIVGIIIVLAISLSFGRIPFYSNDLVKLINMIIFLTFEAISTVKVNSDLLFSDFDDEDHNLYRQVIILHLIIHLAAIGFIAIFHVFANADIDLAFLIIITCIGIILFDILAILMSINWNAITQNKANRESKVNFSKLIHKLKSKLLTTKVINNENTKDTIKWK